MVVAVAGAASFLTPIATPANMIVMGPGGYRFGDYWKLGLVTMLGLVGRRRGAGAGHLAAVPGLRASTRRMVG